VIARTRLASKRRAESGGEGKQTKRAWERETTGEGNPYSEKLKSCVEKRGEMLRARKKTTSLYAIRQNLDDGTKPGAVGATILQRGKDGSPERRKGESLLRWGGRLPIRRAGAKPHKQDVAVAHSHGKGSAGETGYTGKRGFLRWKEREDGPAR